MKAEIDSETERSVAPAPVERVRQKKPNRSSKSKSQRIDERALHDELEIPLIYVSHAPDEVARLVVLEQGRALASGSLWVRDSGIPIGQRVRILARDISIALETHPDSSILNVLLAKVEQLADDTHPALTLVRLNAGSVPLIARRSTAKLDLHPGLNVWA